jgi:hypothetical protein
MSLLPEVFSPAGGFLAGLITTQLGHSFVDWRKTCSEKKALVKNFKKEIELNLAQINSYLDSLDNLKQFISEKQKGQLPITLNPKAVTVFAYRLLDKGYLYELYEVKDVHRFQVALSYCNGLICISQTHPIQLWYEGLKNGKISEIEIKDLVENDLSIEHLRQESLKIVNQEINSYTNNIRNILLQVLQKI